MRTFAVTTRIIISRPTIDVNQNAFFPLRSGNSLFPSVISAMDAFVTLPKEELLEFADNLTRKDLREMGISFGLSDQTPENLKRMYWEKKGQADYNTELTQKATQGDTESQYTLGMKLLLGHEIEKDESDAVQYLNMSANARDPKAQYALAMCHILGLGVDNKNEGLGVSLLEEAAAQENIWAQYYTGVCYFKGIGVSQDISTAKSYFEPIANKSSAAQYFLDEITLQEADILDFERYQAASSEGDSNATYKLGVSHLYGYGTNVDEVAAMHCFESAITDGHLAAHIKLAVLLRDSDTITKDAARARRLLEYALSVEKVTHAYDELAVFYEKGLIAPKDNLHARWLISNVHNQHHQLSSILEESNLMKAKAGDTHAQQFLVQKYKAIDSYFGIDEVRANIWERRSQSQIYMIEGAATKKIHKVKSYFTAQAMGRQTSQPTIADGVGFGENVGFGEETYTPAFDFGKNAYPKLDHAKWEE